MIGLLIGALGLLGAGGTAYAVKKTLRRPTTPTLPGGTPTFTDSFSTGSVDTTKWAVSNKVATCTGTYNPANVDLAQGMLRLTLTQTKQADGSILCVGGELKSLKTYGYGKYSYTMRVGTTSPTATGTGSPVSGSVSAGWNYEGNSLTEIDFEIQGSQPDNVWMTSWDNSTGLTNPVFSQQSMVAVSGLANGFHTFDFVWRAGRIDWFIDGVYKASHTNKVPTTPAQIVVCLRGANGNWGGTASPGVTRYMYVKNVSFTPLP